MTDKLARIDGTLTHVASLAGNLRADPDGHLHRSVEELRAAFAGREAIEPAVERVRDSVEMLRSANREGTRREFQRRASGLDDLAEVVERELVPHLRQLGFEV
jgi:hypothetical protein